MGQTFEELIGNHLDHLYTAALCFTLDEHRAEELLQEATIRAFHEFCNVNAVNEFREGMLAILVSTYLQRQRRMGRDPLAYDSELLEEMFASGSTYTLEPFPEPGTAGYRLLRDWMSRVWPELNDGDRLVLWLADVERFRHSHVADMTGLDEEEVRVRHYRARRMLSRRAARELGGRTTRDAEA
jgi:RNA polymerase sigma-70 factor (ECF subfamily)